jgi:hypothetical protein
VAYAAGAVSIHRFGDVGGGDRAEETALLADAGGNHDRSLCERGCDGSSALVDFFLFLGELAGAGFRLLHRGGVGRRGELARQEVVAGITVGDVLYLSCQSYAFDVV